MGTKEKTRGGGNRMRARIIEKYTNLKLFALDLGVQSNRISQAINGTRPLSPMEEIIWVEKLGVSCLADLYPDGKVPRKKARVDRRHFRGSRYGMFWVRDKILEVFGTLDKFAKVVGVTHGTISNILKGAQPLTAMERFLWAERLGVEVIFFSPETGAKIIQWEEAAAKAKADTKTQVAALVQDIKEAPALACDGKRCEDFQRYHEESDLRLTSIDVNILELKESIDSIKAKIEVMRKVISDFMVERAGGNLTQARGDVIVRVDPIQKDTDYVPGTGGQGRAFV